MDSSPTPTAIAGLKPVWPNHQEIGADFIGEVIDGRFKIIRRLAKGGMAHVFLAKDRTRKCQVSIKLLHRTGAGSRRRFETEAQVLSNIQHEHIVRAIAFGQTVDGQLYMALEYLEGETLSQRLARGPMPWHDVAELGAQIAGALHSLHDIGVIHRDIKPDNIMIAIGADRAVAKVIDLGLASVGTPFHEVQDALFASQVTQRHKTQLGLRVGTPAYLPPEAGLCEAEPRLDVYSLGVMLYQLCTQALPEETGVRPIQALHPHSDAPEDLSRLLRAALEPDVADRLPSADHLRRGLEAILTAHPRATRPRHLFGGSYDRLEVLGVGASAIVYRASDRHLSREVALKVLRAAEPSEDDTIRFRRAAKILSALHHPNIPRILHFGADAGQLFAVTELCAGSPASELTHPGKHLRPDEVILVGQQLASAFAAVHAAGVVYRDLHVGNVLIARGEEPQAWIFDFDHSQVSPVFYARLTERWATPPEERVEPANEKPLQRMDYAAPEVRAGGAFTVASDVFALGLLLYRLLTGLRPFPATGGEARPPSEVCPACPPGLEDLLLSMLNPGPSARPTLAAIQIALEDEQAELEAELAAEREEAAAAVAAPAPAPVVAPAIEAVKAAKTPEPDGAAVPSAPECDAPAAASTRAAEAITGSDAAPTAAAAAIADGAAAMSSVGPASAPIEVSPAASSTPVPRRSSRALLGLVVAAAACLMIARATVPHEELSAVAIPEAPVQQTAHARTMLPAVIPEAPAQQTDHARPEQAPELPPDTGDAAEPVVPDDDVPPVAPPDIPQRKRSRIDPAAAPARGRAVSMAAATSAAQRAVPALRACEGAPSIITADLDIVRGRVVVTALNNLALAPGDPRFAWHACAQRALERVRFPNRETAGHVRIRLPLE